MDDYQKILEENKNLEKKVQKLEEKIAYLSSVISDKKESNRKMFEKYTQRGREINRLKVHIEMLESKIKKSEDDGAKD